MQWEQVFGDGFKAVLTFVYWIDPPLTPEPGMFEHRDRWYLLMGIDLAEYRNPCGGDRRSGRRCPCRRRIFAPLPARSKAGYDANRYERTAKAIDAASRAATDVVVRRGGSRRLLGGRALASPAMAR